MTFDEQYDEILRQEFVASSEDTFASPTASASADASAAPRTRLSRYTGGAVIAIGGVACTAIGALLGGLGGSVGISPAAVHSLQSAGFPGLPPLAMSHSGAPALPQPSALAPTAGLVVTAFHPASSLGGGVPSVNILHSVAPTKVGAPSGTSLGAPPITSGTPPITSGTPLPTPPATSSGGPVPGLGGLTGPVTSLLTTLTGGGLPSALNQLVTTITGLGSQLPGGNAVTGLVSGLVGSTGGGSVGGAANPLSGLTSTVTNLLGGLLPSGNPPSGLLPSGSSLGGSSAAKPSNTTPLNLHSNSSGSTTTTTTATPSHQLPK